MRPSSLLAAAAAGLGSLASAASLQQVTSFGANPSGAKMYIYVPDRLAANPPVIVAIHYCSGTAGAYFSNTPYRGYADTYGLIVVYPESPYSGTCWDVSSRASLTHDGGGNSNAIANMVTYTLDKYNGDRSRVFVTGTSSGAMMTNVMAATYPELFAAGIAYSGVPAGCFYTGTVNGWNSTCSQGNSVATQQAWAQTALDMYPGYSGPRPRMQIYHGSADTTLYPRNWNETVKQWAGVFGYGAAPLQTLPGTPGAQYTKYVYGPNLEGIYGTGVGHSVPVMGAEDLKWFGITGGSTQPGTTATTATTTTTRTTQSSAPPPATSTASAAPTGGGCTVARWGQCGGSGWGGCSVCASPYTCQAANQWYSQCL
ncbi:putative acetylxylan esterase A [Colletotrichum higginsianum]|uniref:Carboxylic ester hydrolase n=1 Tax=Colletotrichum higginsianum TaxID=80884 RepID=A0A4T0WH29_9PEZI|nr:putative acetylxylan esterase A [Colletotrichum higginsianum]